MLSVYQVYQVVGLFEANLKFIKVVKEKFIKENEGGWLPQAELAKHVVRLYSKLKSKHNERKCTHRSMLSIYISTCLL